MPYVVVIDPGHGGEEFHGGEFGPYVEKDLTLVVSNVMKNYLEQFDDVTVYMTRNDDSPVDLKARCDFAKSVNADLLVSIHFNMSSNHNYYGAEVWIPCQNSFYKKTYPLASLFMESFDNMGIYNRGIKTRIGSSGGNYYAILRHATDYGIPSCIVEHCHMDNFRDIIFLPTANIGVYNQALTNFGVNDAISVAKYLKLKSSSLGVDYSKQKLVTTNVKQSIIRPDESAPELNKIELLSYDNNLSTATIKMTAKDSGSYILYYQYSLDGGLTFSPLLDWPRTSWNKSLSENVFTVNIPKNAPLNIVTIAYNSFDKYTISNVVTTSTVKKLDKYDSILDESLVLSQISIKEENVSNNIFSNVDYLFGGLLVNSILIFAFMKIVLNKILKR